jgi:hypothetical protein
LYPAYRECEFALAKEVVTVFLRGQAGKADALEPVSLVEAPSEVAEF